MLQQEAYLLFYIRDKDYKPINIPFPPGSPALKLSSSHFKADPNFPGRSNKQFPSSSSQRTNLDKTGTPLVRLKPTGVVQPSPQKDTPKPPTLPTKGQGSSLPVVTPKSKSSSVSPNSSSSGGSGGNGMTSPMMREFSIPLRKLSSTMTPSRTGADKSDTTKTNAPPPPTVPRQQPTPTAATSLQFTPRQISAPPSKNKKKVAVVSSASLNQGTEKASAGEREAKGATSDVVQEAGIQAAPSIASQSTSDKIASKGDESATLDSTESKAAPAFKVIPSEEPATGGGGFIGPLLPSSPTPAQPQSPLRVTPFSLKPPTTSPVSSKAVAMVPPQPQARGKPIARVRPNPHHQEDEESAPKEGDPPPSTTPAPHLNAVSPWKVRESSAGEVFGPALPDDMDYNSAAHGWSVSAIPGGDEGQEKGEQATPHGHGKAKKHKKKKKHRKREEGASGESEGERGGGGKRERSKENSSKKVRRERDERGRRHYSHSPEREHHHHHHDPHRSLERTLHHDKHRNYRRHSHRDRDRDIPEHYDRRHRRYYSKGNRYPHHDQSSSHSRSRSRSPLNHDPEDRYHHHRHRMSPSRHAHQSHHHAPYSDAGEGGGGHWKNHHHSPHHRPKHSSDSGERRVNIKSDEARRRERKRGHHHDTMSEEENDHKKYKKSVPSGK